jgi:hypothetical protein
MARLLNFLPWRRRRLERDLDREMRYHVDRRIDDLRRSGVSDTEARRLVALEFGGALQVREEVRRSGSAAPRTSSANAFSSTVIP